jgi:hypothetical protein
MRFQAFYVTIRICLIAMVASGLTVVIPGTNVEAREGPQQLLGSNLHGTSLPNHGAAIAASNPSNIGKLITAGSYLAGLGFGVGAIVKFKANKDNPTQIHISQPITLIHPSKP